MAGSRGAGGELTESLQESYEELDLEESGKKESLLHRIGKSWRKPVCVVCALFAIVWFGWPYMGAFFGRVGEEQPRYTVVYPVADAAGAPPGFEIRKYEAVLIAETPRDTQSSAFRRLAAYIGVFQAPHNRKAASGGRGVDGESEAIPMTAPVLMRGDSPSPPPNPGQEKGGEAEAIPMTAPVLMTGDGGGAAGARQRQTMAFVLPKSKYKKLSEVPRPTDPLVTIREVPERLMAARRFSGSISPDWTRENLKLLEEDWDKDEGRKATGYSFVGGDATPSDWFLAGYNPPFIPGWFKTNDILVEVTVHDPSTSGGNTTAT